MDVCMYVCMYGARRTCNGENKYFKMRDSKITEVIAVIIQHYESTCPVLNCRSCLHKSSLSSLWLPVLLLLWLLQGFLLLLWIIEKAIVVCDVPRAALRNPRETHGRMISKLARGETGLFALSLSPSPSLRVCVYSSLSILSVSVYPSKIQARPSPRPVLCTHCCTMIQVQVVVDSTT